jgi:hypothetical protein
VGRPCLGRSTRCKIGRCWPILAIRAIRLVRLPKEVVGNLPKLSLWELQSLTFRANIDMAPQITTATHTVLAEEDDVCLD